MAKKAKKEAEASNEVDGNGITRTADAFELLDEVPTMKRINTRASTIVAKLKELDKPGQWVKVTEQFKNNSSPTQLARSLKMYEGVDALTRARCVIACIMDEAQLKEAARAKK